MAEQKLDQGLGGRIRQLAGVQYVNQPESRRHDDKLPGNAAQDDYTYPIEKLPEKTVHTDA